MKVTIGIPAYNCEGWIEAAIRSALAQTFSDKEVIVVDDGSVDGTADVCARFGSAIRFLRQPNLGGNVARNRILKEASGDWVQYLDADDALPPGKAEAQLSSPAREEADVLCSPVLFQTWRHGRVAEEVLQRFGDPPDWKAEWLRWNLPQTGGCLWRRHVLQRIGGWDETLRANQDYELYARALRSGCRFVRVDAPPAIYRLWSEGTVCRADKPAVIEGKTRLIRDFLAWLQSVGGDTPVYRRLAGVACFEMARTLASQNPAAGLAYFKARREENLITISGPAAPWRYRWAARLFGFGAAESLARRTRGVAVPG